MALQPPVFVFEEETCLYVFRTEADLLGYLEPWYAEIEHRGFDCEGRAFELFADPPIVARKLIGPLGTDNAHQSTLFIRHLEEEPSHATELESRLRDYLVSLPPPRKRWWRRNDRCPLLPPAAEIQRMALPELVALAVRTVH